MASLSEELISTMAEEKQGYDDLYDLARTERQAVIDRDLPKLSSVTEQAQAKSDDLKSLQNRRLRILKDMSEVLGHDENVLTVSEIIEALSGQEKEKEALIEARDALVKSATKMQFLNQENKVLLEQAMEMIDFDLQLYKSTRQAPETANYGRDAENTGELLGQSGFDFKQ